MNHLLLVGLAGAAGSFHCLGMCSGFALSLAPSRTARWKTLGRHMLYNLGRIVSYCLLGVAAGSLGQAAFHASPLSVMQRGLAVASGVLMMLMALQFFGVRLPLPQTGVGAGAQALLRASFGAIRGLLRAPGAGAPLAFGLFNGLLPCPLVYAFLAQAVASGSLTGGVVTMAAFGAGTIPAMLGVGLAGCSLPPAWRLRGVRVAGVVILLFGAVTLLRGIYPLAEHDMPGMPGMQGMPAPAGPTSPAAPARLIGATVPALSTGMPAPAGPTSPAAPARLTGATVPALSTGMPAPAGPTSPATPARLIGATVPALSTIPTGPAVATIPVAAAGSPDPADPALATIPAGAGISTIAIAPARSTLPAAPAIPTTPTASPTPTTPAVPPTPIVPALPTIATPPIPDHP